LFPVLFVVFSGTFSVVMDMINRLDWMGKQIKRENATRGVSHICGKKRKQVAFRADAEKQSINPHL